MASATTEIILSPAPALQPTPLFTPAPKAAKRVLEFFTAQISNDHTRPRSPYLRLAPVQRDTCSCD